MRQGYQDIKILARNFDEFQSLTKTCGELAKLRYIKFIRMRSKVHLIYKKKIEYVKKQDFINASDARDKETSLIEIILKDFIQK